MTNSIEAPGEREAIVAWLRDSADTLMEAVKALYPPRDITLELANNTAARATELRNAADAIKRGDHLSEQGEG